MWGGRGGGVEGVKGTGLRKAIFCKLATDIHYGMCQGHQFLVNSWNCP